MANICSNFIHISGDDDQLEALSKRLEEQDPELLKTVPNFTICPTSDYCINNIEDISFEEEITFYFGSKGICPLDAITELSSEYPDLNFDLNFEEAAMEYFGTANIFDGGCSENEMEELEYIEQFNDEYIGTKALLEACSYEDFVRDYTHDKFFDEHPFGYLDRIVVKKIKDKDLALFINRQWFDDEAEEEFKRRLSGGSKVDPSDVTDDIIYIGTDQPEECRDCGCRTDFSELGDGKQLHVCPRCGKRYILEFNEDEE